MPKQWTDEERAAFGAKMKVAREKKSVSGGSPAPEPKPAPGKVEAPEEEPIFAEEQGLDELKAQMKEIMETNALLKAAVLNQSPQTGGVGVGSRGQLVGEQEKYLTDPALYPSPVDRLKKEPRLIPLAFDYNYDLLYQVDLSRYETAAGVRTKEPKFTVTLRRNILDDQGNQTNRGYVVQRYIFHEDPETAMILANEMGLEVNTDDERAFLNEMRYYRVRDWLFNRLWPKVETALNSGIGEEVIGGQLVEIFTKSSENSSSIDFDKLTTKL